MFKTPFEFEGRIRRLEYGITLIIYVVFGTIVNLIVEGSRSSDGGGAAFLFIFYIPALWFLWAQGSKRCHDVGKSGWFQLIPFYIFWMLFEEGDFGQNQFGENPKGINNSTITGYQNNPNTTNNNFNKSNSGNSYQGGYNGGHNGNQLNNQQTYSSTNTNNGNSEYRSGDLYK